MTLRACSQKYVKNDVKCFDINKLPTIFLLTITTPSLDMKLGSMLYKNVAKCESENIVRLDYLHTAGNLAQIPVKKCKSHAVICPDYLHNNCMFFVLKNPV